MKHARLIETRPVGGYGLVRAVVQAPDGRRIEATAWRERAAVARAFQRAYAPPDHEERRPRA